jgi:hypothetical protein
MCPIQLDPEMLTRVLHSNSSKQGGKDRSSKSILLNFKQGGKKIKKNSNGAEHDDFKLL